MNRTRTVPEESRNNPLQLVVSTGRYWYHFVHGDIVGEDMTGKVQFHHRSKEVEIGGESMRVLTKKQKLTPTVREYLERAELELVESRDEMEDSVEKGENQ